MPCESPLRIRNQYNKQWMYVPCRHCSSCMIDYATLKQNLLTKELSKHGASYLITLDYDNYSVPFILRGMNVIMRYAGYERVQSGVKWVHYDDFPVQIDFFDDDLSHSKLFPLQKHKHYDGVGVLYYPDFSNFIKRLRKIYDKSNIKFRYFADFEYGSRTNRPHFHAVLTFQNPVSIDDLSSAIVKSWPMCPWSRSKVQKSVKRCNSGASSYVASYVVGSGSNNGLCSVKRFRPKTVRSKNIAYGVVDEESAQIAEYIRGGNDRFIRKFGFGLFETIDRKKLDRISARPLSSRAFYTYFHKFKGFGNLSFDAYASRARCIYSMYNSGNVRKNAFIQNGDLASADLAFIRSYRRYKSLVYPHGLDLPDMVSSKGHLSLCSYKLSDKAIFEDYIKTNYNALNYYAAIVLKYDMLQYETMGLDQYILTRINSYAHDVDLKKFRLSSKMARPIVSEQEMLTPSITLQVIASRKHDFNKYLLPKHFNDL